MDRSAKPCRIDRGAKSIRRIQHPAFGSNPAFGTANVQVLSVFSGNRERSPAIDPAVWIVQIQKSDPRRCRKSTPRPTSRSASSRVMLSVANPDEQSGIHPMRSWRSLTLRKHRALGPVIVLGMHRDILMLPDCILRGGVTAPTFRCREFRSLRIESIPQAHGLRSMRTTIGTWTP